MVAERIGAPAIEPVSLDEAKAFLRLGHDGEDDLVAALIAAARERIERATGRAMIAQDWRATFDAVPPGRVLRLPVRPVLAVIAVTVAEAGGETRELGAAEYEADLAGARVALAAPVLPGRRLGGIAVAFTAGYGNAASSVPEDLRQAVRLVLADSYANRGDGTPEGGTAPLPPAAAALIAPFRARRLSA